MKHQRHFVGPNEPREAVQIRILIADLDRVVQIINCDIAAEEGSGYPIVPRPHIRCWPGRYQRAETILGTPCCA
jgi:hypothetical protein